ncbi:MAG: amidohydrolase family protein [Frisingicoccus sp.]
MKTLLKNALVVTMNANEEVYSEGSVLVEDDKISKIGHFELKEDADEVIDCKGKIIMPGLINTHVHTSQQLGRGLGDDVNLLTWLHDRIWPYESNMTEEDSYVSTLATCLEQIKCGRTAFAEPGGQHVSGMAAGWRNLGFAANWQNLSWTAARDFRKYGRERLRKNWINRKKI